jgi:pilus assembly protein CpaE
MSNEEGLSEKIRVVLNRVGSDAIEEGISLKKAEEVIGKPIFWQIPNDTKALIAARVAGAPLVLHNPKCRAQMAFQGLAQALSGKPNNGSSTEMKAKTGFRLFGRRT